MTLEQLRTFVAVAERQHMTRAAEALNLTQQAVSSAIVTLENAYSIVLFRRVSRRIELTEAEIAVAAAEKGPRRCCRKQTTHQKEKLRPSRAGANCGRTSSIPPPCVWKSTVAATRERPPAGRNQKAGRRGSAF